MDSAASTIPESSYWVLALWAFVVFIVWYFFRHSERGLRIGFVKTASLISVPFVGVFAFLWYRNLPELELTRIAVLPFPKHAENGEFLSWESLAIAEAVTDHLSVFDRQGLVAYDLESIMAVASYDSLSEPSYLSRLAKLTEVDFMLSGAFQHSDSQYVYKFRLTDVPDEVDLIFETAGRRAADPLTIGHDLYDEVVSHALESTNGAALGAAWTSRRQLKNFYNSKLYYLTGQMEAALEFAEAAVGRDSTTVKPLIHLAALHIARGARRKDRGESPLDDFNAAQSLLDRSLTIDEENSATLSIFADLYVLNEKWLKAEESLKKAKLLTPLDPRVYLRLTRLHPSRYRELGFEDEEHLLRHSLFLNPAYMEPYVSLADLHSRKRRHDLAIKTLNHALSINPNHVNVLMSLGSVYLNQKQMLEALQIYEKVLDLDPQSSDVYYNLGIFHYYAKDYGQALQSFEHALSIDDHLDSYLYLAYIHELEGRTDRAIEYLQARVKRRKNDEDRFAEEARKHLFRIMSEEGKIDSLFGN
jgi:tetratricopeptide (TPR) repeat protein